MTLSSEIRLGEIAEFIRGINFKPDDVVPLGTEGSVGCMRTKNVQDELDCSDVWAVPKEFVRREEQMLAEGDILVSSANSWNLVGKCSWIPKLEQPSTFGGFVSVLRAKPKKVEPRFLYRWFSWDHSQALLRSFGQKTTNISNLNIERCLNMKLTLPSLTEQRRIAAILDQADALRAKRREALAELDKLSQAIFIEMFGGHHVSPIIASDKHPVHPKGWEWRLLTDYARLATGHTPDREKQEYWNGDIPWISLTDIRGLNGKWANQTSQSVTPDGVGNSSAVILPKGTVCFSRTASVGFVTIMGREMATSQDFVNWVPGPNLDAVYLMYALMMSKPQLLALSTGSTHRTIYMRVVEHFKVLTPPFDLQREFARRVDGITALVRANQEAMAQSDALFTALQHRAFRGEL